MNDTPREKNRDHAAEAAAATRPAASGPPSAGVEAAPFMPPSPYAALQHAERLHAARPFLDLPATTARRYGVAPASWSYAEVRAAADELAARYEAAGCRPGMRVALMLDNRPEFFFHFFALNRLGVSVAPIHGEQDPRSIAHVLDHADVALAVRLPHHAERLEAACRLLDHPVPVAQWRGMADDFRPAAVTARNGGADAVQAGAPRTEAAILYTSGTTGVPKGCRLSNEYFTAFGDWYRREGGLMRLREGGERLITPLPVSHMNALACSSMAMLMSGGCLIPLDRFHPREWWRTVRESRATILHYLGVMPAILLQLPESPEDDLSGRIRFGFGAGVDPRHHERFEQRFGFPLIEAWAMTETGAGACIAASREPRKPGSRCFGRPDSGVVWKLVDEQGREVAPGEPGELLVRRAGDDPRRFFFTDYHKDRAATEEAWAGGWFHTGDVVRVDADGLFHFVDRRKNIIRRSGENIAAVEVETCLVDHPEVAALVVVPVADEIRGEEVMALVVPRDPNAADAALARRLFAHVRGRLAYFKAPGYIAFVAALPMTASQKLQRGEAKRLAARLLEDGAVHDLRSDKRPPRPAGRARGGSG